MGEQHSGRPKVFDSEEIGEAAKTLVGVIEQLNGLDSSAPSHVDAGPYAPLLADTVNGVYANLADLILRLEVMAEYAAASADNYWAAQVHIEADIVGSLAQQLLNVDLAPGSDKTEE